MSERSDDWTPPRLRRWFRRQENNYTAMSNYPAERCMDEPQRIQLEITMKKKSKLMRLHMKKKFRAVLNNGILELHHHKKVDTVGLSSEYRIDLSKVVLMDNGDSVLLKFKVESLILRPIDYGFQKFKEAIHKHRLWRQEHQSSDVDKASIGAKSTVTASSEMNSWDMDGIMMRMLESIREMNSMTVAVLQKSTQQLSEVKNAVAELRQFKANPNNTPASTVSVCSTANPVTNIPTPTAVTTTATEQAMEEDEEEDSDSEDESAKDVAKTTMEPELLYSLESVRSDWEERSKKALARSKRALVGPKVSEKPEISRSPPSKKDSKKKETTEETKEVRRQRREMLPAPQLPSEGIGWKQLLQLAVHRTGLPLTNYEPVSNLQLIAEELAYSYLLNLAAGYKNPEDRMSFVTAFAVSGYTSSAGRCRKPFNPILGETFDYEEAGWKFHAEQVSHHPPISAAHAEHKNWTWWNTTSVDSTIAKWSRSCEITFEGGTRLRLKTVDGDEEYCWNKVKTKVENLTAAPEQRKVTHDGLMKIYCSNGYTGRVYFKKQKDPRALTGDILAPNDRLCFHLQGNWDKNMIRQRTTGERETLYHSIAKERFPNHYGFTRFTMGLNENDVGLPPSDSRLRRDMRDLESGRINEATQHKDRLEKIQRTKAKQGTYVALWFEPAADEFMNNTLFVDNGKYWPAKAKGFDEFKGQMAETTV